jgi:hypothetical protein
MKRALTVRCAEPAADIGQHAYLRRRQAGEEVFVEGVLKGRVHPAHFLLAFWAEGDE